MCVWDRRGKVSAGTSSLQLNPAMPREPAAFTNFESM